MEHLKTEVKFDSAVICPQPNCMTNVFGLYSITEKKEGKLFDRLYFVCTTCHHLVKGDATMEIFREYKGKDED